MTKNETIRPETLPDEATMYTALVERDTRFEGVFFFGVRTTGIFCRPSCSARKPRRDNVEYFASTAAALADGYRPCRVCNPIEPLGAAPDWIKRVLREIPENGEEPPTDVQLRTMGVDPARIRRWFKQHHGMTFRAYLRLMRINAAYRHIRSNGSVTDAAFANGYESLSGFGESFRRGAGFAPSESNTHALITVTRIPTPLGPMLAAATESALCLLEFTDRPMLETQLKTLHRRFRARTTPGTHPLFERVEAQLGADVPACAGEDGLQEGQVFRGHVRAQARDRAQATADVVVEDEGA